ncbi:hypothetical protein FC52_GL000945 [Lactobacillus pasteurii DSM 23907 = CRBIP 24.76]|uniref:Uncharacterized protein n=1 Tax=Lactobacillus pasteurii DSM 23907 = CRBIP 24.76 TaxID=1423790 RepID=I7LDG2_9LACO|nr:hypothetical protein [Lactobacillus pasteurii]KRK08209.1 hypothetical protein FC52_GL000945 [Lactobacillus pasteurii DSM 23907 = CRBIP 24.76]TDG77328.1 hypothetical protein C5L33_000771 [Lactobacillus pasteurii]CCI84873.1 Putative uncharacterized protein [Lactobacillus pasteurii DSM 23907 = CRBIP 24.76]
MNIAYLVIGVLLLLGGLYAFRHTQNYLKLNTGSKTTTSNQWWGFGLWFGYIAAGIFTIVGVILIIVSFF